MDVYEIERYIRNNSIEANTLTEVLMEKLKEVSGKYEQLTEVLENYSLCSYDSIFLDTELKEAFETILNLEENITTLQNENETLKNELKLLDDLTDFQHDELESLKHDISYLQNDLNVLKEDF